MSDKGSITSDDSGFNENEKIKLRDKLLTARQRIMAEQRNLFAQLQMKEQSNLFLKALSDPEFAKKEGVNIALEIGGKRIQLVPRLSGEENNYQLNGYKDKIKNSMTDVIRKLDPVDTLEKNIKANENALKNKKKILEKLGAKINLETQNAWLKDTVVVLDLSDLSVCGRQRDPYAIPDEYFKNRPSDPQSGNNYLIHINDDSDSDSGSGYDADDETILNSLPRENPVSRTDEWISAQQNLSDTDT